MPPYTRASPFLSSDVVKVGQSKVTSGYNRCMNVCKDRDNDTEVLCHSSKNKIKIMAEAEAKNKQNKKSYKKSISCDLLITLMDRTNKDWPLQRVTGIISVLVSHGTIAATI